MSIYFLKAQGLIKIGYSADVARRVKAVASPFAEGGEVLGIIPGDRALEAFLHDKFKVHHSHGEWFDPAPAVLNFIAALGAPTEVPPDKEDDRTLLQTYDETHADHCADCLQASRLADRDSSNEEFYCAISKWSGVSVRRLKEIHSGKPDFVTSAEYTICRALGQAAGFNPSMRMDAVRMGRASADRMGGE